MHLEELTKVSYIDLSSTGVTDAGVNELKLALPNVTIVHESFPTQSPWNRPCRMARRKGRSKRLAGSRRGAEFELALESWAEFGLSRFSPPGAWIHWKGPGWCRRCDGRVGLRSC